jgi:hypothetical protein
MPRQTLAVIVGAIVLFAGVLVGTLAFTGGDSNGNVHTMTGGMTMTDPMHTMPGGQTMTGGSMP